jgi:outer membrane receptor for ferrienterochelin and colicin
MQCIRILTALLCVAAATASWAEDNRMGELAQMSMEELFRLKVSVASIGEETVEEQSAIVSVITAEEIAASGARDLVDVLWLVPGYHFGVDISGVTGVGIRGFWAYEGKTLLTLDGVEIVEDLFGVVPVDEHIPVDQIDQIEIIRGPGSAMYGGNAELSVINITTKGAKLNGGFANADFGTDGHDVSGRVGAGAGWGNDDWHAHIGGSWSSSYRSTSKYLDNDSIVIDLDENSDIKSLLLNAGVDYKDLELRFLYDAYDIDDRTRFGCAKPRSDNDFGSIAASGKYDFRVSDIVSISPKLTYKHQKPWYIDLPGDEYQISTQRLTANLTGIATLGALGPADSLDVLMGGEFTLEGARADLIGTAGRPSRNQYYGGKRRVDYKNYAAFLQAELDSRWVAVTLGGRYHYHSEIGGKFVPRAAFTKVWDRFHAKALISQAFRTPQIEIIQFGGVDAAGDPNIKSETTTAYELEAGYRLSDAVSVVANAFWIEIADILVYSSVENSYENFDAVTNYGVEAELRVADEWGSVALGYSFYRNHHNDVPAFCTSGSVFYLGNYSEDPNYASCGQDDGLLLGFPAHKLTFNGTYFITDHLSFNLNGAFISKRISYKVGMLQRKALSSQAYANVFLRYQYAGFSVGVGIRDLFDNEYGYVQPFDSGVRELPGKGREFFLKASYEFDATR